MTQQELEPGRPAVTRSGRLLIGSATRISVTTVIAPAVRRPLRISDGGEQGLSNLVSDAIIERLREAGRPWSIFASPGSVSAAAGHIVITQQIGLNRDGRPYRVVLTARQGAARWSATLDRSSAREIAGGAPILPNSTTPDGREYWDVSRDAEQLASQLRDELILGSVTP